MPNSDPAEGYIGQFCTCNPRAPWDAGCTYSCDYTFYEWWRCYPQPVEFGGHCVGSCTYNASGCTGQAPDFVFCNYQNEEILICNNEDSIYDCMYSFCDSYCGVSGTIPWLQLNWYHDVRLSCSPTSGFGSCYATQSDYCGTIMNPIGQCCSPGCDDLVGCYNIQNDYMCNQSCGSGDCVGFRTGTCQATCGCSDYSNCSSYNGGCGNCGTCSVDGSCSNDKSTDGTTCSVSGDCCSGNCVDGVCCDSACGGTCQSCDYTGQVGTCYTHSEGTDPDNECFASSYSCDGTCRRRRRPGTCDGESAACENEDWNYSNCASGTACSGGVCGSATYCDTTDHCVGDIRYSGKTCDGDNNCDENKTILGCCADSYCSSCGSGDCSGNYECTSYNCTSVCNTDNDSCGSCGSCSVGSCTGDKEALGNLCSVSGDCCSNYCSESACVGLCPPYTLGDLIISSNCVVDGEMYVEAGNLTINATVQIWPSSFLTFNTDWQINIGSGYILKSASNAVIRKVER